ncbi:thioredoxin-domain-containing protein [Cylindrobasidium torrendii FP15055 ss-10]|uniref:Thioredoxin-domain-containing protein n=1 Tax=Cylindrobasidium torrendii FP15055 ss-10 TaxID=1314674 RepID=A0A0D7BFP2_9AGAR|nr:thioredoxin-domain-containing protein [Cylindrobasidium torrendii FP15055 ss-10]
MRFWQALLTSLAITCSAVPVNTETVLRALNPENFKTSVANGVWFVEHYSPYCGHCRHFAPTWEELVKISETDVQGVTLAQVNCAVDGDLCNDNGIKGYPTLNMYKDGEFVEKFSGARELESLVKFIKRYAPEAPQAAVTPEPVVASYIPNPDGLVRVLNENTFASTIAEGPAFVKFYAPWCGHCKKLAPKWKDLARQLQGKLTIAEVNCDDNKALCKTENIEGFPTLVYYSPGGSKTDYSGSRQLDALKAFAEKASAPPTRAIAAQDIDNYIREDKVAYFLLHSSPDTLTALSPLFATLLGSPTVYTVSNPSESLFTRFGVTGNWALLAFKDNDVSAPTAVLSSPVATVDKARTQQWLATNRLPTTIELTQDTFQSVMKSPAKPLVVLAAVNDDNKEELKRRFSALSASWRKNGKKDREVVFAWMDLGRWKDWMKSMYGVSGKGDKVSDVPVVVADHQALVYWNVDADGKTIDVMDEKSVFSAVEGAAKGTIKSIHSENLMERLARHLNVYMQSFETFIVQHPFMSVVGFFAFLGVVILAMQRWILSDLPDDRHREKGRLD